MRSTALMRRGLIHIARMDSQLGLQDMIKASEVDPTNGDVFHHRGQVIHIMVVIRMLDNENVIDIHVLPLSTYKTLTYVCMRLTACTRENCWM